MRLNEMKKACIDTLSILQIDTVGDGVYLSNGRACWPVPAMRLTEQSIKELFNLTPQQAQKVRIRMLDSVEDERYCCTGPNESDGERILMPLRILGTGDDAILLLRLDEEESARIIAVRMIDIRPARRKDQIVEFWLRPTGSTPLVVGYVGMEAVVIAMPIQAGRLRGTLNELMDICVMECVPTEDPEDD